MEPRRDAQAALVLGHGAGGGVHAKDLVAAASAAQGVGLSVALVEQPYRVAGRRSPAPAHQLDTAWTAVIEHLLGDALRGSALVVGGRSSGAASPAARRRPSAPSACSVLHSRCSRRAATAPRQTGSRSSTRSRSRCSLYRGRGIRSAFRRLASSGAWCRWRRSQPAHRSRRGRRGRPSVAPSRHRTGRDLGRSSAEEREHRVDAPVLTRVGGELELAEDRAHVRLDRLRRDIQLSRNPAVGLPSAMRASTSISRGVSCSSSGSGRSSRSARRAASAAAWSESSSKRAPSLNWTRSRPRSALRRRMRRTPMRKASGSSCTRGPTSARRRCRSAKARCRCSRLRL